MVFFAISDKYTSVTGLDISNMLDNVQYIQCRVGRHIIGMLSAVLGLYFVFDFISQNFMAANWLVNVEAISSTMLFWPDTEAPRRPRARYNNCLEGFIQRIWTSNLGEMQLVQIFWGIYIIEYLSKDWARSLIMRYLILENLTIWLPGRAGH